LRGPLALLLTLLAPALAWGAELSTGTSASAEYDSNVYRNSAGKVQDDVVFRLTQRVRLSDSGDGYQYHLRYRIPYQVSVATGAVNDFNHYGGAYFSYDLGPWTTLTADGAFAFVNSRSTVQDEQDAEAGSGVLQIAKQNELVTRANGSLTLDHRFSSRLNGNFNFSYSYFNDTDPDRRQVNTIAGLSGLNYAVNSRNRIGFGANFSYQDFADLPGQPGSETLTVRVFGSWVYRFNETLSLSIRAGPTWIDTTQRGADPVVEAPSPFLYQELEKDTDFPADSFVVDTNGDGVLEFFSAAVTAPAGSLVIAPEAGCPVLTDSGVRVAGRNGLCPFQSLLVKGIDDAAIDAVLAAPPKSLAFVDPPGPPPSFNDQSLTLFGTIRLEKRWSPRVNSGLSYRRTQSDASGLGGATILDAVVANVGWRISPLWRASFRADWTSRKSIAPATQTYSTLTGSTDPELLAVPGLPVIAELTGNRVFRKVQNEVDTQRWSIGGRIERTLTPKLKADLRLNYNQQTSRSGSAGKPTDLNNFLAILGFSYRFDSIEVW
jgi:hypothetical protein